MPFSFVDQKRMEGPRVEHVINNIVVGGPPNPVLPTAGKTVLMGREMKPKAADIRSLTSSFFSANNADDSSAATSRLGWSAKSVEDRAPNRTKPQQQPPPESPPSVSPLLALLHAKGVNLPENFDALPPGQPQWTPQYPPLLPDMSPNSLSSEGLSFSNDSLLLPPEHGQVFPPQLQALSQQEQVPPQQLQALLKQQHAALQQGEPTHTHVLARPVVVREHKDNKHVEQEVAEAKDESSDLKAEAGELGGGETHAVYHGPTEMSKSDEKEESQLEEARKIADKFSKTLEVQRHLKEEEIRLKQVEMADLERYEHLSQVMHSVVSGIADMVKTSYDTSGKLRDQAHNVQAQFLLENDNRVVREEELPHSAQTEYQRQYMEAHPELKDDKFLQCPQDCAPDYCDNKPAEVTQCFVRKGFTGPRSRSRRKPLTKLVWK
eukprot:GHVT01087553.1.p1 GENE.GHVT01087553.1~~GHVT01087553.1.p1  ORF type:complete len:435 (-),score=65.24 GHVT01087553.1:1626-2930(-)